MEDDAYVALHRGVRRVGGITAFDGAEQTEVATEQQTEEATEEQSEVVTEQQQQTEVVTEHLHCVDR
eukprot:gene9488-501_t